MKNLIRLFAVLMLLVCNAVLADVTFVHTDALGSPVAETNSDGQLVRLSHYKPFGEELEQKEDDVAYTGHKYDAALGLIYMQARYYDPVIGRFYSNDPIGFRDVHSFNRYAYANNNPYKYVDPDGRSAKFVKAAYNVVKKASKDNWNFKKAGKEELAEFADNMATLADGQFTADDVFAAIDIFTGFGKEAKGVIYRVSGDKTESGKPYIGRSDNLGERASNATDGRDRDGAEIIGTYPLNDRRAARKAEQQAIDKENGLGNTDNKRNEIAESKRGKYDLD